MDAMSYEYLIRKAYNCGRGGAGGKAEATIYRKMERAENALKMRMSATTNSDLEYDYRSAAMGVSMNVNDALRKVISGSFFSEKNKKSKKRLEELASIIAMNTDRKTIDEIIEEAHGIFKELGIEMN